LFATIEVPVLLSSDGSKILRATCDCPGRSGRSRDTRTASPASRTTVGQVAVVEDVVAVGVDAVEDAVVVEVDLDQAGLSCTAPTQTGARFARPGAALVPGA
jgi:hypothetical protein